MTFELVDFGQLGNHIDSFFRVSRSKNPPDAEDEGRLYKLVLRPVGITLYDVESDVYMPMGCFRSMRFWKIVE